MNKPNAMSGETPLPLAGREWPSFEDLHDTSIQAKRLFNMAGHSSDAWTSVFDPESKTATYRSTDEIVMNRNVPREVLRIGLADGPSGDVDIRWEQHRPTPLSYNTLVVEYGLRPNDAADNQPPVVSQFITRDGSMGQHMDLPGEVKKTPLLKPTVAELHDVLKTIETGYMPPVHAPERSPKRHPAKRLLAWAGILAGKNS